MVQIVGVILKVFVIGPIYPFRGGIAHSNLVLCNNLARNHDVTVISFKRMFPKFLYPGKSQYEPNPEMKKFPFKTEFMIDAINPMNWIAVSNYLKKEKPDRIIFQWWHPFFVPCYAAIAFLAKKDSKNLKIGMVGQVIILHESGLINEINVIASKLFFKTIDYFITLSSGDTKELAKIMPSAKIKQITEPTYADVFTGGKITRNKARSALNLNPDEKIILFFGFIRPYKGLMHLLNALPLVLNQISAKLIIAGEFWSNKKGYLDKIAENGLKDNILLVDNYIPNEDVELYFKAADVIVLPYTSAAESGIIQTALGFNTPIITTNVGGNSDLIIEGQNGLLAKPEDEKDLAEKILLFFNKGLKQGSSINKKTDWDKDKEGILLDLQV